MQWNGTLKLVTIPPHFQWYVGRKYCLLNNNEQLCSVSSSEKTRGETLWLKLKTFLVAFFCPLVTRKKFNIVSCACSSLETTRTCTHSHQYEFIHTIQYLKSIQALNMTQCDKKMNQKENEFSETSDMNVLESILWDNSANRKAYISWMSVAGSGVRSTLADWNANDMTIW